MMKIFAKISILLLATGLVACSDGKFDSLANAPMINAGSDDYSNANTKDELSKIEQGEEDGNAGQDATRVERKLVKTGDIRFETSDIGADRKRVLTAVKELGGYIGGESEQYYGARHEVNFTLKVPADKFDQLVEQVISGVSKIDSKNIHVSDVTMEFYDLEARIKSKREIRARYSALLAQAKTVSSILDVERELGNIQTEIESMEGRMNVLQSQVSLGTLELVIYEGRDLPKGWAGKFGDGFKNGWEGFIWFLIILVNLWPLWVLTAIVWFSVRALIRRGKSRQAGR